MRRLVLLATAITLLLGGVGKARAEFVITFSQVGANVEAVGSGSLNLSALAFQGYGGTDNSAVVNPQQGDVLLQSPGLQVAERYALPQVPGSNFGQELSGPSAFGTGGGVSASTGTGLLVGINRDTSYGEEIWVPDVDVFAGPSKSGGWSVVTSYISSSATFDNTTISGLGLTPGTYTWSWGSGADADSLVVEVPSPTVATPEPSTLTLLGIGVAFLSCYAVQRRFIRGAPLGITTKKER